MVYTQRPTMHCPTDRVLSPVGLVLKESLGGSLKLPRAQTGPSSPLPVICERHRDNYFHDPQRNLSKLAGVRNTQGFFTKHRAVLRRDTGIEVLP